MCVGYICELYGDCSRIGRLYNTTHIVTCVLTTQSTYVCVFIVTRENVWVLTLALITPFVSNCQLNSRILEWYDNIIHSIEFRVEWCILISDSILICLSCYICVGVKTYRIWETVTNLTCIICYYTSFDAKFNVDFEFEVKNLCLPTHIEENRVF